METRNYQTIIVGSGAGGATLARELSTRGRPVLVLEQGKVEKKVGTFADSTRYYDVNALKIPKKSKEGVILWRTFMAGGATMVAMGNISRSSEKELAAYGLDLNEELAEAEKDLAVSPLPDGRISAGGLRLREAARLLGHSFQNMTKCIDAERCISCGHCSLGCARGARWSALTYLQEAERLGAKVLYQARVRRVLQENGQARGVQVDLTDESVELHAETIILAAGGLGTPVILQNSGIPQAGEGLFVDLLVNTYGVTDDFNIINEPQMAQVDMEYHPERGFILATQINHPREVRLIELGPVGYAMPTQRLAGLMTKIVDEPAGKVYADGSVSKPVTDADWQKLKAGMQTAKEILIKAGVPPNSIRHSMVQGAHPGGTAAIGRVVDEHLMTEVKNLYVCDASVLPKAPGLPPILILVALAKRLAKQLTIH
ncbi:MAG: FAD-dependent oxidoreductase [Chloroflexota bacterium]